MFETSTYQSPSVPGLVLSADGEAKKERQGPRPEDSHKRVEVTCAGKWAQGKLECDHNNEVLWKIKSDSCGF